MSAGADLTRALLLVVLIVVAAVLDVRRGIIPNWLTVPGFIVLIALTFTADAISSSVATLVVAVVVLAVGLGAHAAGIVGGGDVKLLAAVAAAMTPHRFLETLLWLAAWSVVFAIAVLASRGVLASFGRRLVRSLVDIFVFRTPPSPLVEGDGTRFSYAVVIAAAVSTSLLTRWAAWPGVLR